MKEIVFATNNAHKLQEIREILGEHFRVLSLADIGCHADIPEDGQTLAENSMQKAYWVWEHYHIDVFADDTGLEVDALGGEPGVRSARYADGEGHDSEANMRKLLTKLGNNNNRRARFRTIITLIERIADGTLADEEVWKRVGQPFLVHQFEGTVEGDIAMQKRGHEGFGYDPVFVPQGYAESFAALGEDVKNRISHRARAVARLAAYLQTNQEP